MPQERGERKGLRSSRFGLGEAVKEGAFIASLYPSGFTVLLLEVEVEFLVIQEPGRSN